MKHLNFSHLADALIQNALQEQLGLSALLKGTPTDFSPSQLRDSNHQPFGYWPNALRLPAALGPTLYMLHLYFCSVYES